MPPYASTTAGSANNQIQDVQFDPSTADETITRQPPRTFDAQQQVALYDGFDLGVVVELVQFLLWPSPASA